MNTQKLTLCSPQYKILAYRIIPVTFDGNTQQNYYAENALSFVLML